MLRFPGFRMKALTLSYDDGVRADCMLMDILNRYGIKCTFNLNFGWFAEKEGEFRLTANEAKKIYSGSGHEIAVHGEKHISLSEVSEEIAVRDVLKDRENLESVFGGIVKGMAYANGSYSDNVVVILKKCGIKYARVTIPTKGFDLPEKWLELKPTCHHNDPELMQLADRFLSYKDEASIWADSPKLFYLWGHSYEFDRDNNWNIMEEFAKKVGNKEDVWYATNVEIYDYVNAYERLEYSIDGKTIYNPSVISVYMNYFGQAVRVCGGETVTVNLYKKETPYRR